MGDGNTMLLLGLKRMSLYDIGCKPTINKDEVHEDPLNVLNTCLSLIMFDNNLIQYPRGYDRDPQISSIDPATLLCIGMAYLFALFERSNSTIRHGACNQS